MRTIKSIKAIGICLATLVAVSGCGQAAPNDGVVAKPKVAKPTTIEKSTVVLPAIVNKVKVDVKKDCGAKGDGVTNDTAAFQKASKMIQEKGGGTLIIPKGTYIVGGQTHDEGQYPYYLSTRMLAIKGVNGLLIEGNNATLRLAPGMRYGSFDKDTGKRFDPPMPHYDRDTSCQIGEMLAVIDSRNIIIRNIELDGNSSSIILGGPWGDTGRQVGAYGLYLYNNSDVEIDNVNSHHHALDGAVIGFVGLKESDPATPVLLKDCSFEYNARQGLSWVGGRGFRAFRCKFNHTQRAKVNDEFLASAPGAGLDIEAESSVTRDGYFEDCEFNDNGGQGMASDSGDGGYTTFKNCTFWGTTNYSIWSKKPGLKYVDCKIYGSAVHGFPSPDPALATSWTNCVFEDKPYVNGNVYLGGFLLIIDAADGQNIRLDGCTFIANKSRSMWFNTPSDKFGTLANCTFTHKNADEVNQDFQALFRGINFSGCHFKEDFPKDEDKLWYIGVERPIIAADPPTVVDGPHVKWRNWSWGQTGTIPPTSAP